MPRSSTNWAVRSQVRRKIDKYNMSMGALSKSWCIAHRVSKRIYWLLCSAKHPNGMIFSQFQLHFFGEGNVFSCVYLSFSLLTGGPHVTITHDALDLIVWAIYPTSPLDIRPRTPLPTLPFLLTSDGHHWRPVQICSLQHPPWVTSVGGHWSTYSFVCKRAVRTLLEWFLDCFSFHKTPG